MNIFLPSLLVYFLKPNPFKIFFPFLIILTLMMFSNKMIISNPFSLNDSLSLILILLTLMSILLIILSMEPLSLKESKILLFMILICLFLIFSSSKTFNFYILFELVLIPTMILITKSGKQPERLQAGIYLIVYTIIASLPLLVMLMSLKHNSSFIILFISLYKFKFGITLMLAFLVKMPMFFTHLWLPKAHVEAPLEGSMILAAVLLKLGGYGLIRIIPLCLIKISLISSWIMSISLLGATSTSMNCIRQKDMKALIAYSSVAHMGLTLTSIFSLNHMGLHGAIIMMIAHGLTSSALFLLVNDLYMKIHTRNIMMLKGLLILSPNITFWWFIFMAINISAPPSINTFSEIFIMSSLILWNSKLILPIIFTSIMTAAFSMSLFINITHNKNEMLPFLQTKQKIFLSLFLHSIPLFLLLMKMEMMYT